MGAGQQVGDEVGLRGMVVTLGEVAAGDGDVVFDGGVAVEVVDVEAGAAAGVELARGAEGEGAEEVGEGVAEEGPEAGGGVVLVLEVDDVGEEVAEGEADAEFLHGGFELRGADVAAVAGDVAVVGEGVDDGARSADVGRGGGVVVAFAEGEEERAAFVGWFLEHVGGGGEMFQTGRRICNKWRI